MVKSVVLLLCAVAGSAQSFYGAGVSGYAQTSPKLSAWFAYGQELSATQHIYSFTETDFTRVGNLVQTSVRSGMGTYLRAYGPLSLYLLADGGVATTGRESGAAVNGAMLATVPISKKHSDWFIVFRYNVLKTQVAGTAHQVSVGALHKSNRD